MKLWSVSFSYRLGLGFHALNNEGADGGNLMQPRRIEVGDKTYDGISGEILRRQILENFINLCREREIPILPMSAGLHPDRGPLGIRAAAKYLGHNTLGNELLYISVREAIKRCAVLDVGGYLAAWKEGQSLKYKAEQPYIDQHCASPGDAQPVKRDSCFDVAWLISEQPQSSTVTQHSAYRATSDLNSRYAQTMRSNIYAGVIRAELHRIGTDDNWYLQSNGGEPLSRLAITAQQQRERQIALLQAISNFIASPTGAKVAAWAPHVFLTEGAIILSSTRTAPFVSPIKVTLDDSKNPISLYQDYMRGCETFRREGETWVKTFTNAAQLLSGSAELVNVLRGDVGGAKDSENQN
jgi:CRISPR-associated autoregulator DevR family